MSNKVKAPWYKRIWEVYKRGFTGGFGSFSMVLLSVWLIIIVILIAWGILTGNSKDNIESTTTYSEDSIIVPIYAPFTEDDGRLQGVLDNLEYYNTKPEKTELTRFISYKVFGKEKGYNRTYSLVDGKDAESLYYHTSGRFLNPVQDTFNYLLEMEDKDHGTLILYNRSTKTYETKPVKKMNFNRKSSKDSVKSHYEYEHGGYEGAPKPLYSYSPTIELIAYKDGSYKWNYKDNWKLDNEGELKAYISPSPTKEN